MFNNFFDILYNMVYVDLLNSLYKFDFFELAFYNDFTFGQLFATFIIIGIAVMIFYFPFLIFKSLFDMLRGV